MPSLDAELSGGFGFGGLFLGFGDFLGNALVDAVLEEGGDDEIDGFALGARHGAADDVELGFGAREWLFGGVGVVEELAVGAVLQEREVPCVLGVVPDVVRVVVHRQGVAISTNAVGKKRGAMDGLAPFEAVDARLAAAGALAGAAREGRLGEVGGRLVLGDPVACCDAANKGELLVAQGGGARCFLSHRKVPYAVRKSAI